MSDLAWFGREIFTLATKGNERAMEKAAVFVEAKAKKIMGTGASKFDTTGDTKKRRGKGTFHRPSAPGFPPNIDTGILRASITHTVETGFTSVTGKVGSDIDHIRSNAEAGTDVEYGFYLELGTRNMQARPWLRPALRQSENDILRIFKEENS